MLIIMHIRSQSSVYIVHIYSSHATNQFDFMDEFTHQHVCVAPLAAAAASARGAPDQDAARLLYHFYRSGQRQSLLPGSCLGVSCIL